MAQRNHSRQVDQPEDHPAIGRPRHEVALLDCGANGHHINCGRDNIADNNIFAECERGVTGHYDPRNMRWRRLGKDPEFILSDLYLRRYPALADLSRQPGLDQKTQLQATVDATLHPSKLPPLNSAWRNVFWRRGPTFTTDGRPSADRFDSLANAEYTSGGRSGFVAAEQGDFRLKPDAEVLGRLGFCPIPFAEIGLYMDRYRTRFVGP